MTTGDGIALAGMWLSIGLIAQVDVSGATYLVFITVFATVLKLMPRGGP